LPGAVVEERRKDDEENELGIERDLWNAGDETEEKAGDYQDDGIRRLQFVRKGGENHHEKQEQKEN
jgi:hypothetical protein